MKISHNCLICNKHFTSTGYFAEHGRRVHTNDVTCCKYKVYFDEKGNVVADIVYVTDDDQFIRYSFSVIHIMNNIQTRMDIENYKDDKVYKDFLDNYSIMM